MGRAPGVAAGVSRSIAAAVMAAGALAASAAERGPATLPCPGRYVVIRSRGPLLDGAGDGIVVGSATIAVGTGCTPAGARSKRGRRGWRLVAGRLACGSRRTIRLQARVTEDCTLMRGMLDGRGSERGRFTAIASRCGDGVIDAGAGEQCDDGNTTSGDGCEEYCVPCDGTAPPFSDTWAAIQTNVFHRHRCTGCHGAAASGGLDLRSDVAYGDLVGVASVAIPALPRVAPGDAGASLLWLLLAKGTGAAGYDDLPGAGMPIGGRLAPADLEAVRQWIQAGAPAAGVVPGTEGILQPCP